MGLIITRSKHLDQGDKMSKVPSTSEASDIAKKAYFSINDKLPTPWGNTNPFELDEVMTKPLPDDKVGSEPFDTSRFPSPANADFPFDKISDELIKIRAEPEFKNRHMRTYIFNNYMNNESKEIIDEFRSDIEGEQCPNHAVNSSLKRARAFLQGLINISKKITFPKEEDDLSDAKKLRISRIFMLGGPGIGKTTFSNYLLSVFAKDMLEKQDTLLLRINMNRWSSKPANFKRMILETFGRIYYEHFFLKGKWAINIPEFTKYVINQRRVTDDEIEEMRDIEKEVAAFRRGARLPDENMLNHLLKYFIYEMKKTVIFLFDGLDYVTLTEIKTRKFKLWIKDIENYILTNRAFPGAYVMTMRNTSFHKATESLGGSSEEIWRSLKTVTIERCELSEMLTRKLGEVQRDVRIILARWKSKDSNLYHKHAWIDSQAMKKICTEFLAFISLPLIDISDENIQQCRSYNDLKVNIVKQGLEQLNGVSCENNRCLMRNLNLCMGYFYNIYKNNPEYKINKTSVEQRLADLNSRCYLVLQALIVGRIELHDYRTPYDYIPKAKTKTKIEFRKSGPRFVLPPITNFMHITRSGKAQFRGLFKIRVLQMLTNIEKPTSISTLLDYFKVNFGYNKDYCRLDIDEMIYSQLIQVSNPSDFISNIEIECNVTITKLGNFVLSKLIYRYIYYEVTLDALPMPESIARCIDPLNYYWMKASNLSYYVLRKARDVMLYLKFLEYAEEKEKARFNLKQRAKIQEEKESFEVYFRPIATDIKHGVREEIIRSFIGRIHDNKDVFDKNLKELLEQPQMNKYLTRVEI